MNKQQAWIVGIIVGGYVLISALSLWAIVWMHGCQCPPAIEQDLGRQSSP